MYGIFENGCRFRKRVLRGCFRAGFVSDGRRRCGEVGEPKRLLVAVFVRFGQFPQRVDQWSRKPFAAVRAATAAQWLQCFSSHESVNRQQHPVGESFRMVSAVRCRPRVPDGCCNTTAASGRSRCRSNCRIDHFQVMDVDPVRVRVFQAMVVRIFSRYSRSACRSIGHGFTQDRKSLSRR